MATLRFKGLIKIHGVNPYVLVNAKRASALKPGWRKPMPVLVRINGKPEQASPINMMPVGDGSFRLYLNSEIRKASGTCVGDRVEVEALFDAKYRSGPAHRMPAWFRTGLEEQPSRAKELAIADSEPEERNSPLLCGAEVFRDPRTESRPRGARSLGQARALHGALVEQR
jgi:Domain of unknown function (DUF1905)